MSGTGLYLILGATGEGIFVSKPNNVTGWRDLAVKATDEEVNVGFQTDKTASKIQTRYPLRVWRNSSRRNSQSPLRVSSQQWGNQALLVFLSVLLLHICILFAYLFRMIGIRSPSLPPPYQGRIIFTKVHPFAAFCFTSAVDGKRIWCSWMVPTVCQEKELRSLKV